jgi:putative phosphoribosyl transferase
LNGQTPELVLNPGVVRAYGIDRDYLEREQERQLTEIARRRAAYLGDRPRAAVAGHTAIVIDDGIATGATVRAALHAVRRAGPGTLVLAVPVADASVLAELEREADRIVCLHVPTDLVAVGQYYEDFRQVEDTEVVAMLSSADVQP